MIGQPDFAKQLDISRERLASYEYGRATVRFGFGEALCCRFNINQRWLALGVPPTDYAIHLPNDLLDSIDSKMLFSEAYRTKIDPFFKQRLEAAAKLLGMKLSELSLDYISKVAITSFSEPEMLSALAMNEFREKTKNSFAAIPPDLAGELLSRMNRAFKDFEREHAPAIRKYRRQKFGP